MTRTIALAYSGVSTPPSSFPCSRSTMVAHAYLRCPPTSARATSSKACAPRRSHRARTNATSRISSGFIQDFIWPTLRAGAIYGRKYLLGTSMGRPLIARRQVEVARRVGADALAHGCTGKGNDQVRFELTYAAFAPDLPVIAPWREWDIRSREDALAYAEQHHVPVTASRRRSIRATAHLAHSQKVGAEDPSQAPLPISSAHIFAGECSMRRKSFDRVSKGTPCGKRLFLEPVAILTTLNGLPEDTA